MWQFFVTHWSLTIIFDWFDSSLNWISPVSHITWLLLYYWNLMNRTDPKFLSLIFQVLIPYRSIRCTSVVWHEFIGETMYSLYRFLDLHLIKIFQKYKCFIKSNVTQIIILGVVVVVVALINIVALDGCVKIVTSNLTIGPY